MSLDPEDQQLGMPGHGWQQLATDAVHAHLVETQIRPHLSATEQAMLRSQSGSMSGVTFACFPKSALSRFDSSQFHVLLLCRLWLPLPPSSCNCRCGISLTSLATTVQLVLRLGCWAVGDTRWSQRQSVPRGWSQGWHQHLGPRLGLGASGVAGCSQA